MAIMKIINWLNFNKSNQMHQNQRLLLLAILFAISLPSVTAASPVVLSCKDNDNLYDAPYTVFINARLMTVSISRNDGISRGKTDPYQISDIQNDNGVFVVTADGKLFNSHIVVTYSDNATIAYSDALTNPPIAIDGCISVRNYKNQSR